jgi:hypothetical protein
MYSSFSSGDSSSKPGGGRTAAPSPRVARRTLISAGRVRRDEVEREHPGDARQIRSIAGDEGCADLPAGAGDEDVENEASTHVSQDQTVVFDERGEGRPQRLPDCRRWSQKSSSAYVRCEDRPLERAPVFGAPGASAELRRNDRTQIQAGRSPGAKLRKRVRGPPAAMCQSIRDSLIPRSARVPRTSSFRKRTKSSAISMASRSVDAPSEALASSSRRGSSQNALRTFPTRVARGPDVIRVRGERRRVESPLRVETGMRPRFVYATP